jgi:chorismate mutase
VSEAADPLGELRARIGANDRAIVEAVNERLRLVTELWELKERQGAERFDPDRERRLRK